tara:strand:+ start:556 stop:699 length:144 start_codon:yes stop_codon:yes gene_type:complete
MTTLSLWGERGVERREDLKERREKGENPPYGFSYNSQAIGGTSSTDL